MTLRPTLTLVIPLHFLFLFSMPASAQKVQADLLVTGTVVSMDASRAIFEDGALAVKGDTILEAGPRSRIESRYTATQTLDARGKLILPGFINGHTHVPMTLLRG